MKIVVASCLGVSRSTRFISLSRACALVAFLAFLAQSLTAASAQQAPPNSPPSGGFPSGGAPQGSPQGRASANGAPGDSSSPNAQAGQNAQTQQNAQAGQNAQGTQNGQNAQNNSNRSQSASTHSVNVASDQIAPFFQISTNANSPIVGEQLTILRLVYGIYSPTERSRRLVAYWDLSGRHAYYNLCAVYLDFVNQCVQRISSAYSSGQTPQETTNLLISLRLVAEQRCEDARLTFLQAQYDFDASFTSAVGRRAAMARASSSESGSKAIGWGSAVLYIPSAKPATDFYNSRFEENSRRYGASKEAARLNSLLPLLYESLQSRANQAIREKDVLIGSFNASEVSATAILSALDRYFEAQRDALEAAIRYNQAIALYVAETTPGYVQGERFLATLNQRVENSAQGGAQNAPAEKRTNETQPQTSAAPNTSARNGARTSNRVLPGLEYDEPTPQGRYATTYRAPGMERWYFPGFDDANSSAPTTYANDPLVDSVSDARVGADVATSEQTLVAPLASSSVSSTPTADALNASSLSSADLKPAVFSKSESVPSENPPVGTPENSPAPQSDARSPKDDAESANAPPLPPSNDSTSQPPLPPSSDSSAQPSAPSSGESNVSPAPSSTEGETQEPEKPHIFAISEEKRISRPRAAALATVAKSAVVFVKNEERRAWSDDELLGFFNKLNDEARGVLADRSNFERPVITRGQSPDSVGKNENAAQNTASSQNRVAELARVLFAPSTAEEESGQVVERTCSLAESLMRVPNVANSRFEVVRTYWRLQRATARLRVETAFLATCVQVFNDADAAKSDSARLCLAAALGAQARVAEAKTVKRSVQAELLRVSNQSPDYGYPIPSTLPFFGSSYELGNPISDNFHTRRSGELIRSRLQGIQKLGASIPNPNDAFSLDVASIANCDVLVALESLEKKRESVLLFIDAIVELNESIAEYVSFFPANAPNERFVEALVGRN